METETTRALTDRLDALEKALRHVEARAAVKQTPVFAIAMIAAFLLFCILVSELPIPTRWPRVVVGLVSGVAGCFVVVVAHGFVKLALKAMVELAAVALFFANAAAGAFICAFLPSFQEVFAVRGNDPDAALWQVAWPVALALFVFDVLVLAVLSPLARVVGTSLDD